MIDTSFKLMEHTMSALDPVKQDIKKIQKEYVSQDMSKEAYIKWIHEKVKTADEGDIRQAILHDANSELCLLHRDYSTKILSTLSYTMYEILTKYFEESYPHE